MDESPRRIAALHPPPGLTSVRRWPLPLLSNQIQETSWDLTTVSRCYFSFFVPSYQPLYCTSLHQRRWSSFNESQSENEKQQESSQKNIKSEIRLAKSAAFRPTAYVHCHLARLRLTFRAEMSRNTTAIRHQKQQLPPTSNWAPKQQQPPTTTSGTQSPTSATPPINGRPPNHSRSASRHASTSDGVAFSSNRNSE